MFGTSFSAIGAFPFLTPSLNGFLSNYRMIEASVVALYEAAQRTVFDGLPAGDVAAKPGKIGK